MIRSLVSVVEARVVSPVTVSVLKVEVASVEVPTAVKLVTDVLPITEFTLVRLFIVADAQGCTSLLEGRIVLCACGQ